MKTPEEMKAKEEILSKKGITENTPHHNYPYLLKSVLEAMDEYANQFKGKTDQPDLIKSVTKCPTCGSECEIGGTTTHYYIPKK